jgi:Transmembrane domain of unknown function (DUF3566)
VTPPDKPGSAGQDTERDADRKSGVATDGQAKPVEQEAAGNHDGDREDKPDGGQSNGKPAADEPTARVVAPDDLELSHGTPPPWQRVTSDNASAKPATPTPSAPPAKAAKPDQPTAPVPHTPPRGEHGPRSASPGGAALFTPSNGSEPDPGPPGEKTVSIERPVVTGAAAARLFADGGLPTAATVPAPGTGMPHGGAAPSRTTVHLEGSGPSTGPLRVGAAATPSALRRPGRGPRRANLQIKRFDPWSVLKLSLVLGVALFFVWLVAVGVLYAVLDGMGVWDKLNGISSEILQPTDGGGGEPLISAGRVFGVAAIIGAVNIVLFSALSTVGAFIYNVSADLAGGLEVTLAERE